MLNQYDDKIDPQKSIINGRIAYERKWSHLFHDKLIIPLVILIIVISNLWMTTIENPVAPVESFDLFTLIFIGILSLLSISAFQTDKLKRIRGINEKSNREIILEIMNKIDWEIKYNSEEMLVAIPSSAYQFNGGVQFTLIYHGNDILINNSTYAFAQSVSPVHIFNNRVAIYEFKKEFNNKINNWR